MSSAPPRDASWRTFVLASYDALLLLDTGGIIQLLNSAAARWLGAAAEAAVGGTLGDLGLLDTATGAPPELAATVPALPGRVVLAQSGSGQQAAELQLLSLAASEPYAYLVRLQPEIPQSQTPAEQLLANVADLLAICDRQGRWHYCNPAWTELLGFTTAELHERRFLDLVHASDRAAVEQAWTQLQATTTTQRCEFEARYLCRDRTYRWLQWQLTAQPDSSTIAISGRNLTARKQAEAATALSEVRERQKSRQLGQTLMQLKQRENQLVQATPALALGRLAYGVARELNLAASQLTHNLAHAQTYSRDVLALLDLYRADRRQSNTAIRDAEARLDLDFVRHDLPDLLVTAGESAARLSHLVAAQQDYASAPTSSQPQAVDLQAELERALLLLHYRLQTADTRRAAIVRRDYGELPPFLGYPQQLRQALLYLLDNAIEAIAQRYASQPPAAPPTITLTTRCDADGERLTVAIADNGCGMDDQLCQRAGELFFTTRPGRGLGLGLPLSKQILVRHHGGDLRYESEPGVGTTVRLEIPRTPPLPPLAAAQSSRQLGVAKAEPAED